MRETRVFLSYAHEDREAVRDIYKRLRDAGVQPWMDIADLVGGQQWDHAIADAIRSADFILLFLSRSSANKEGHLQKELRVALERLAELPLGKIFIIPIRLEECQVPEPLRDLQHLDYFREGAWERLLQALGKLPTVKGIPASVKAAVAAERDRDRRRKHVFVAMPFTKEMGDTYHYGIQRAVDANEMVCERVDQDAFTGDVLGHIKERIDHATAIIADLTGANPNVYLELGYAWGKGIPAILIAQDAGEMPFDVRGQRCLVYDTITSLERLLSGELTKLRLQGDI